MECAQEFNSFHSQSQPLHADSFDWRKPSYYPGDSDWATFSTTQNWGMGSTIGVVLIIAMSLDYVGNQRKERSMKKLSSIYQLCLFLILYLPIFYLIGFMPSMLWWRYESIYRFSLTHFENLFGDLSVWCWFWLKPFYLSFCFIATIIGTFGAIYILSSQKKYQEAFLFLSTMSWW